MTARPVALDGRPDLAIQLYSLRAFGALEQQLTMIGRSGFDQVETFDVDDPVEFRRALDVAELKARSGHFVWRMIEQEPERVIQTAGALGLDFVVMPYLQPSERPADRAGWAALGHRLAAAALPLERADLRVAYHNHDFEFAPLADGTLPIEHLLGGGIAWEADLAWVTKAGADPMRWLERFRGRVPLVHVKDIAPDGDAVDEDGWADPGLGTMNWPALWRAARAAGAEVMIAEHDNPKDGARFARNSAQAMTGWLT